MKVEKKELHSYIISDLNIYYYYFITIIIFNLCILQVNYKINHEKKLIKYFYMLFEKFSLFLTKNIKNKLLKKNEFELINSIFN